jgi:hypothetical protein
VAKNKPRANARGDNSRAVYPNSGNCTGVYFYDGAKALVLKQQATEAAG